MARILRFVLSFASAEDPQRRRVKRLTDYRYQLAAAGRGQRRLAVFLGGEGLMSPHKPAPDAIPVPDRPEMPSTPETEFPEIPKPQPPQSPFPAHPEPAPGKTPPAPPAAPDPDED
jgi:hypothetical protein